MSLKKFALEIISRIDEGEITNKSELNKAKLVLSKKYKLKSLPTDPDILLLLEKKPVSNNAKKILAVKPVRSLSGISVVAVMAKPHKCPGKCIYCPSGIGKKTPKSYTGKEPAAMRGLMFNFDPYKQTRNRIEQLRIAGHSTEKLELIIMGGTFLSTPPKYQSSFIKRCLDAANEQKSKTLAEAKLLAEHAPNRIIGTTFETRPDYCKKEHINRMLSFGGTRTELGVQTLNDLIYKKVKRGHTVKDVENATSLLKDSAFKVAYHFIPGLPGSTPETDLETFELAFRDQRFKPDMVKIYPCLVIKGTPLYKKWARGEYSPLNTEQAAEIVAKVKAITPKWVRIMRVQRDIPTNILSAGVDKSNLRQLAQDKLHAQGGRCQCIRCREAGLKNYKEKTEHDYNLKFFEEEYSASEGTELFISAESPSRSHLYGFARLRIPYNPFREEISNNAALLRELRVFGTSLALGSHSQESQQHRSLGKQLLEKAEQAAQEKYDSNKLVVISGLGVREYYYANGYSLEGEYVSKKL